MSQNDSPLFGAEFDTFWRAHELSRAVATAGLNLLQELTGGELYGQPLPFAQLEAFRCAVQRAHEQYVQPPARKPDHLKLVQ